ncbi:MAG: hypothetical protein ABIK43_03980 [candidate division WOR-3 bacterium]
MKIDKARQSGHLLVDFGVVFHRAGPERVESFVNVMIQTRQSGEMASDIHFADFRQRVVSARVLSEDGLRIDRWHVQFGQ